MSYISTSGASSAYSSNAFGAITTGSTVPALPLVSGTTYTALSWTVDATSGSNGRGTYAYVYKVAIDGDNTTAFQQVVVNFLINGVSFLLTEILVATTLPNVNQHNFVIPFIYTHGSAVNDVVTITVTPTFIGTAPTLPVSNTNIIKIA